MPSRAQNSQCHSELHSVITAVLLPPYSAVTRAFDDFFSVSWAEPWTHFQIFGNSDDLAIPYLPRCRVFDTRPSMRPARGGPTPVALTRYSIRAHRCVRCSQSMGGRVGAAALRPSDWLDTIGGLRSPLGKVPRRQPPSPTARQPARGGRGLAGRSWSRIRSTRSPTGFCPLWPYASSARSMSRQAASPPSAVLFPTVAVRQHSSSPLLRLPGHSLAHPARDNIGWPREPGGWVGTRYWQWGRVPPGG